MNVDTSPGPRGHAAGRAVPCCPPLAKPGMSAEDAGTAATLLKALADPVRVRIVNLLAQRGKLCVCDLQAAVDRSQPTVSFHLAKLVRAGLVRRERRGPWAYYALDRERLSGLADLFGGAR